MMAEGTIEGRHFEGDDDNTDTSSDTNRDYTRCSKLPLAENLVAYMEKRELIRDSEAIVCDNGLVENVMTNYIIAKKIISNLLWQEKLLCKHVCSVWHSAVHALQKEAISPVDFVMDLTIQSFNVRLKNTGNFYAEPLAVLTFANMLGFNITHDCEAIEPCPCTPTCGSEHCLLDMVQRDLCAPKDCMLTVRASYLSFMSLPQSITYKYTITHDMFVRPSPFIGGLYIPKIPNVEFKVINIKSVADMQKDFYDVIDKMAQTRIFKGVLVYVTESYLLHTVEDIIFLNYFKDVQPDIPYALGGCIVEDTTSEQSNLQLIVDSINTCTDFVSENLITVALFTVPKNVNGCHFDMYSLIIESSDWTKAKIQKTINQFAKKVPRFEHSVVLKLSCVGRDQKHELEQDYFRAAFPHSRLVGCYGNGELGVNHPARAPAEDLPSGVKRHRRDPGPQFGIMYSYSTVFVYIGWGKVMSPAEAI